MPSWVKDAPLPDVGEVYDLYRLYVFHGYVEPGYVEVGPGIESFTQPWTEAGVVGAQWMTE